jgi:predicted transcriptional regulator YdeE
MHYEKSYRQTFTVAGIAGRVSNAWPEAMDALWQRFHQEKVATRVLERTSDAVYALYRDYERDHTGEYTMVLGYEVPADSIIANDTPKGLVAAVVPAATYALIEARGEQPAALIEAWKQVWASTLPRNYICDFEVHWGPETVELYISIR